MADTKQTTRTGAMALAIVALIWTGMVIGVSGLATPVKFQAVSLSLPVALEVGQVTFSAFNRVEWLLALLLLLSGAMAGRPRIGLWLPIGLVAGIVLAQTVWLLPVLDARIAAVINGNPLPPSNDHIFYVIAEGVKLVMLLAIALGAVRACMARRGSLGTN